MLTNACSSFVTWSADELPAPVTTGPDANGIMTTTEYYIDDDGKKVKVREREKKGTTGPELRTRMTLT